LLDNYGYRWMVHRPEKRMFRKQAVCISTAAGAGTKSTNKDMAHSTFFWGIAKTYQYGVNVAALSWDDVSDKLKNRIEKKTSTLARKIQKRQGKVKPSLKTRIFFHIMRHIGGLSQVDRDYWKAKGWTYRKNPWSSSTL
ncbi:MAG: flavin reductase, partial [Lachnospiraceae bacterium]|nr:flavin reductase [Lachnospiraceae bacterium]